MLAIIGALFPIFLLIVVGYVMHLRDFPGAAFWPLLDRLVYFVCFPSLLLYSIANGKFREVELGPLALSVVGAVLALAALLFMLRPVISRDGPAFASLFQGSIRFNTFVGLGAVATLHGSSGVAIFAVITGVIVPMINVLCVSTLARFGKSGNGPAGPGQVLLLIAKNPLIIACLLGLALNLSGIGLPAAIGSVFEIIGRAALPLGLISVGAGLDLKVAKTLGRELPVACAFKFVCMPLAVVALSQISGLHGLGRDIALIWAVMPTAPSAYILSRQLGGDSPMMAAIITAETLLAFIFAPLMIAILG